MQTSIKIAGCPAPADAISVAAIAKLAKRVINKLSSISERTWLAVAVLAALALIVYAGRFSATGTFADRVALSAAAMTATIALGVALEKQSPEKGGETWK